MVKQTRATKHFHLRMKIVANADAENRMIERLEELVEPKPGAELASALAAGILLFYGKVEKESLEKELRALPPDPVPRRK